MTGPPTPPPTSEIEIKDAARSSGAPQGASSSNPPQSSGAQSKNATYYNLIFPTLADLAAKGNFKELASFAELKDLKVRLLIHERSPHSE